MYAKIIKYFGKIFYFLRKKNDSFHPNRDWKILVFTFFFINMAVIAYLLLFYFKLGNYDTWQKTGGAEIESLDKESIYYVLDNYEDKEERFRFLSENRPVISNPSN